MTKIYFLVLSLLGLLLFQACTNSTDEDPNPAENFVANDFRAFVNEGVMSGEVIGTIDATSQSGTLSFAVTSQNPQDAIQVNASTGEITVDNASVFVFANNPQITANAEVSNGTETKTISITININEPGEVVLTIWTGSKIPFSKASGTDPNQEANQDRITDNVWITRDNNGGPIINAQSNANNNNGPGDTEWAVGNTSQIADLQFTNLRAALGGGRMAFRDIVDQDLVLHLITDDIYIDVTFTQWASGRDGGFAYERSTE